MASDGKFFRLAGYASAYGALDGVGDEMRAAGGCGGFFTACTGGFAALFSGLCLEWRAVCGGLIESMLLRVGRVGSQAFLFVCFRCRLKVEADRLEHLVGGLILREGDRICYESGCENVFSSAGRCWRGFMWVYECDGIVDGGRGCFSLRERGLGSSVGGWAVLPVGSLVQRWGFFAASATRRPFGLGR